ncbi:MAG: hypothetical protein ACI87E_002320 [Mariniblastus sp.]
MIQLSSTCRFDSAALGTIAHRSFVTVFKLQISESQDTDFWPLFNVDRGDFQRISNDKATAAFADRGSNALVRLNRAGELEQTGAGIRPNIRDFRVVTFGTLNLDKTDPKPTSARSLLTAL